MSKILFLKPPLSLKELYNDLSEGGSELPPIGLCNLAAVTRKEGYKTKILDALALKLNIKQTVKIILENNPDYLGISSTTLDIFNSVKVANMVKRRNKYIKIILGGPHITSLPEETMKKFSCFDIGVIGEGENTIIELLKILDKKKSLRKIKGLIVKGKKKLIKTKPRPFIKNLDKLPMPAWDLLPNLVKYYQPAADSLHRSPATLLITSRGCSGRCNFCDRSVFGNCCRGHSAEYVIKMIKYLQKNYGIKDLFIEDDNFLLFKPRLKKICKLIKKQRIDITFSCMGRVDTVDEEILNDLKGAGCWQINYGCESGSQKLLDLMKKNTKVKQVERAIKLTKKAGIRVKGLFMLGNLGETKETIKQTLKFIKKLPLDDFHMTYYTPFPGSEASKYAHKYGNYDSDWKKINMFNSNNFVPFGFTKKELEKWYKKIWKSFYLRPRIILYYLLKMKNPYLRKKIIRGGISFLKFLLKKNER